MRISPFQARYIRKRATELMADQCKIWRAGPPVLDRTTGKTTRAEVVVKYQGKCRFWEVPGSGQVLVGDQQVVLSQSYMSIPYDAPVPESDDIVEIIASADTDLVGRTVNIVSIVRGGGLRASRRFLVELNDSQKATW